MNTRMRTGGHAMKGAPKHDKGMGKEKEQKKEVAERSKVKESRNFLSRRERKIALQKDVDKLRNKLSWEENVHKALKRAFTRPLGVLPRLPPYLPSYTLELLAEVAVLEEEVVWLEEQVVNFRQGLYQEAICVSSSNRSAENELISCPSNRFSGGKHLPKNPNSSRDEEHGGKENRSNSNSAKNTKQSPPKKHVIDRERVEEPNKLSEEILRCLLNIFSRISLPKNTTMAAVESEISPSVSGSSDGFEIEEPLDPYDICSEFGRRDIGPYKHLHELEARSVDRNLSSNSLFLTQRLKSLLKKLESVDISQLSHHQKLAFWINIYNSCMMNAFLGNGMPTTPQMVVEQMLKAKVNVGGQLVSAMTIEHFILRLPYYSNHLSLEGLRSEEKTARTMFKLDWPEPLVTFALSCGTRSSPPVRVYTASQVQQQLEEAKSDYLQAAVGISKPNRLGIPKLLDWYMLDFAKNMESLMEWICLQLPTEHRDEALECLEMSSSLLFPHPVQVFPYDFRFRYLILP